MERSTPARTVVGSVVELFAGFRSPVVVTDTVLVTLPIAVLVTPTVMTSLLLAPDARARERVKVSTWPTCLARVHLEPENEMKLNPAGSTSVMVIGPTVEPVPTFPTTMLYTPFTLTTKLP